jgi:hypothetical protein
MAPALLSDLVVYPAVALVDQLLEAKRKKAA